MTDPTIPALEWAIDRATEVAHMHDINVRHDAPEKEQARRMWSYVLALKGLRDRLVQEQRETEDLPALDGSPGMNTLAEEP